jgi:hypothetical protein
VHPQVRGLTGATAARPAQRFFAQCQRCSLRQATALRHNKRVLVLHMRLPRQRSNTLAGEKDRRWVLHYRL